MKIEWLNSELFLRENRPLRVTGASGIRVFCLRGTVWITTTGQTADIFLHDGQWHEIDSAALTLIEGVGEARIRFERPALVRVAARRWCRLRDEWVKRMRESAVRISRTGRVASGRDSPA
ncbi:MAG: DUF2917 domain-containing protein [Dechloromonas sp.]|nr:DUF2917 domain-containing protein [Dechloromonas sp.]